MGKRKDWFLGKSDSPSEKYHSGKDWFIDKKATSSAQTKIPSPPIKPKGCPSCGAGGLFFKADRVCALCGKIVCSKCVPVWYGNLSYKTEATESFGKYESTGFCSIECCQQFFYKINDFSLSHLIKTSLNEFPNNVDIAWNQAIFNAISLHYKPKANTAIELHSKNYPAFPTWNSQTKKHSQPYIDFYFKAKTALAENLEKCGRTQDAAKVYEELQSYDKARELRQQDRHIIVKNTIISPL